MLGRQSNIISASGWVSWHGLGPVCNQRWAWLPRDNPIGQWQGTKTCFDFHALKQVHVHTVVVVNCNVCQLKQICKIWTTSWSRVHIAHDKDTLSKTEDWKWTHHQQSNILPRFFALGRYALTGWFVFSGQFNLNRMLQCGNVISKILQKPKSI